MSQQITVRGDHVVPLFIEPHFRHGRPELDYCLVIATRSELDRFLCLIAGDRHSYLYHDRSALARAYGSVGWVWAGELAFPAHLSGIPFMVGRRFSIMPVPRRWVRFLRYYSTDPYAPLFFVREPRRVRAAVYQW